MNEILELLKYPFIVRALIVGICISFTAAIIGVILVQKKYSMIGHGLGEIGFAALSLAVAFNLPPLSVSIPLVIIASFIIMGISQKKGIEGDTIIAIVSASALAFGVIVTAITKGFNIDVCNYMFGSILAMTNTDIILSVALTIVVLLVYFIFYNRLVLVTYDDNFAKASGINVTLYQFIISAITALVVVLGMRMMGTLMISSIIVFPAIISKRLTNSFKSLVVVSGIISVICFVIGIFVSFFMKLPTGSSIVLVNILLLIIVNVGNKLIKE